uniref:Uncharacterized protein ycf33 n=1 Tax=Plumaria plumosa TaxID=189642 RepID=A0A4D6WWA5_9FLOR|nr:hypothetical protein [Plumaria plumosa]
MYTFWDNLNKFPRFLIATLIGFFLTTFEPISKLLKNKKTAIIILILIIIIISTLYLILRMMVGFD